MVAVILIIILLVLVALLAVIPYGLSLVHSTSPISVIKTPCPSNASGPTTVAAPSPNYDEQQVMLFAQSYASLSFNVTAIAQCDANGYGPAYLLNGVTNSGFWYQVGISWDWPLQTGGYAPGFDFVSEDWAPGGLTRGVPTLSFNGTVNSGDIIELGLSISNGRILASAVDLNTTAGGSMSYPARTATSFIGLQAQQSQPRISFETRGYFTGLMMEWYHVTSNYTGADEQNVTFSVSSPTVTSATLGVGEWNFTTNTPTSVFSAVANNGNPISLSGVGNGLQKVTLDGFTLRANAYELQT